MRAIPAILCLALLSAGCQSNTRNVHLSPDQLGGKYARQSGYFAACGTTCYEEETPGSIRHDAILDEVTLASVAPEETCFDVVLRTSSGADEPFAEHDLRCEIDGKQARAVADSEVVTVRDYAYTGEVETLRAEGVTQDAYMGLSVSEPREMTFRVIERSGSICCGAPAARRVALELRNRAFDFGASSGHVRFEWELRD